MGARSSSESSMVSSTFGESNTADFNDDTEYLIRDQKPARYFLLLSLVLDHLNALANNMCTQQDVGAVEEAIELSSVANNRAKKGRFSGPPSSSFSKHSSSSGK